MQRILQWTGLIALACALAFALAAVRAYVSLDIPAVLDDLSGRARQRDLASIASGRAGSSVGAAHHPDEAGPREGPWGVGTAEDAVATSLAGQTGRDDSGCDVCATRRATTGDGFACDEDRTIVGGTSPSADAVPEAVGRGEEARTFCFGLGGGAADETVAGMEGERA